MNAISKRLCKLENRGGGGPGTEQKVWVVTTAGRKLALDDDTCVGILRECEFLSAQRWVVVDLGMIPDGLDAKETERFLREKGAQTCRL